jgi:protein-tyrosine phosphatase
VNRQLNWDGCLNARHLGGFVTDDGHVTSNSALARSDNLVRLSGAGRAAMLEDGVRTIIDLRFPQELEREPNPFSRGESGVTYRHLPMMTTDDVNAITPVRAATTTQEAYRATLDGFQDNIGEIVRGIADSEAGRVVLHCSAGKDRTGLAVALVLRFVGVSAHDLTLDYLETDRCLQPTYEAELAEVTDEAERARRLEEMKLQPTFILETLAFVDARYGSVRGYLETCGLDAATLTRLHARLLM